MIALVPDPTVSDVPAASGSPWLSLGVLWAVVALGAVVFAVAVALVHAVRRR